MKQSIHPTWHHDCAVTCSCGNSFTIGSTQASLVVDICNKCHPFFTGEMRFVDRQGRVDKFMKKMQNAQGASTKKKAKKTGKDTTAEAERKSYQDILRQQQAQIKQSKSTESDSAPAAN